MLWCKNPDSSSFINLFKDIKRNKSRKMCIWFFVAGLLHIETPVKRLKSRALWAGEYTRKLAPLLPLQRSILLYGELKDHTIFYIHNLTKGTFFIEIHFHSVAPETRRTALKDKRSHLQMLLPWGHCGKFAFYVENIISTFCFINLFWAKNRDLNLSDIARAWSAWGQAWSHRRGQQDKHCAQPVGRITIK